jgi:biopolymer transport protein ExbD
MRFRKRTRNTDEELNITAFLNLMVVLIPFLLLNAVFAQVAVLNLNLPAEQATPPEEDPEKKLSLEVLIYSNRYEVADRTSGSVLSVIDNEGAQHDRDALNEFLVKVKGKFPDVTAITLLCEEDTPYELLIHTMDTVRFRTEMINGEAIRKDLFPDISIGSAPPDTAEDSAAGGAA